MTKTISQLGEFGFIESVKKYAHRGPGLVRGIGDDAAVLAHSLNKYQLFTTDMMAEDVHFVRRMGPAAIGYKAMACNISDIAAMGGVPTHAVVAVGIPKTLTMDFVTRLYQGLNEAARLFDVSIAGGDTIKSEKIIINVSLLGEVEKNYLVTRDGAKPKDWIFVTGALGGSLSSGRHLNFTPRVAQARFLVKQFKPSAMMDISDGLAGDLNHILKASGVGAELDLKAIPCNPGVKIEQALSDGEDYELLFTLPPATAQRLMRWQEEQKALYYYPIGTITSDKKQIVHAQSYTHF